jgi:uncharacterized OB-fold protein
MSEYKGLSLVVSPSDSEHRGYFEAAKQRRLVVQQCDACRMLRTTFGAACPFCTSLSWKWHSVSGRGTIFSWQVVTRAVHPAFEDWLPYPIVLVQLDEQPNVPWRDGLEGESISLRLVANLCSDDPALPADPETVAIGKRVEVCFLDLTQSMALPQFRLAP